MDIQIAILCDAATDTHGKLNILGTFDTIYTSQLPAVQAHAHNSRAAAKTARSKPQGILRTARRPVAELLARSPRG